MSLPVLPLRLIESLERRLVASVAVATSPFTGGQQVQDWGGDWWEYQFDMALTKGAQGRLLSGFFAGLGGPRGWFLFADPSANPIPGTGAPIVALANQTGARLATEGWEPDRLVLRAGDLLSLGGEDSTRLYQVPGDVTSSAEPPPMKWSAPIIRKAEDLRWPLRDPSPKRLS
ncbi:hypothetical protein [Nioella sp.]|uniref:hypothetical protein n=1 Tax=Nioella sp. TaxID=1912091 RepID=UPI003A8B907B